VRFGRKAKHHNGSQSTEGASATSGGSVATEERSALLSFTGASTATVEPEIPEECGDTSDPTQDLLSALGRFQTIITDLDAPGSENGQWTDSVMDQLVEALEVAIQQEWDEAVEALTDTGRILHAYEDAGQPEEAIPFLRDAYSILCLMVGDLIVGDVREAVSEKWRDRYGAAKAHVDSVEPESTNLDAVGDESPTDESTAVEEDMPFDLPGESNPFPDLPLDDALPALDELPQLDDMLELGIDAQASHNEATPDDSAEEADEGLELFANLDNVSYLETKDSAPLPQAEESTPKDQAAPNQPTQLMVEILDRICDQLSRLEQAEGEDFSLYIERIAGGVGALRLEAEIAECASAAEVCALMEDALTLASASRGHLDKRFTDVAYAFCGEYIDAIKEEDSDSVSHWKKEVISLVETWETPAEDQETADQADSTEVAPEPLAKLDIEEEAAPESTPSPAESEDAISLEEADTDSTTVSDPIELSEIAEENGNELEAAEPEPIEEIKEDPVVAEEPECSPEVVELSSETTEEEASAPAEVPDVSPETPDAPANSFTLLESAQKAAAEGDGVSARFYALQAAARIAGDEAAKAELHLESTEVKLKASWNASASAREDVTRSEQAVTETAAMVSEAEAGLGKASSLRAEQAQAVSDLEEKVLDLEEQMKALVERHKEEEKNVTESRETFLAAETVETDAKGALSTATEEEKGARVQLESARQGVKDLQRRSAEIETQVSGARENLLRQKNSLEDIEGTISHICGKEKLADAEDTLLF
jgi:hypothetical protein